MNKLLTILKSRKVINALITLVTAIALSYGYNVSPEFKAAVASVACEIVECTE